MPRPRNEPVAIQLHGHAECMFVGFTTPIFNRFFSCPCVVPFEHDTVDCRWMAMQNCLLQRSLPPNFCMQWMDACLRKPAPACVNSKVVEECYEMLNCAEAVDGQ
eukprot:366306-Chlamydomonas_euryale.AAC.1